MYSTETRIFIAIIIAACILFVIIAFFIAGIMRYQRISLVKQREKINADMLLLEQERTRLSADLHDEFGMMISAIKISLHCMEITGAENGRHLSHAESLIDELMGKIRVVSADLMPVPLHEKGLDDAVQQIMDNMARSGSIKIDYSNTLPPVSGERKIHIYRLIQEITNNTIKHAAAENLTVSLKGNGKKLTLRINDDGKGFHRDDGITVKKGLGLLHITRRVEMLGGKLYLDTAPGKGTSYLIEIPQT
ncbi:hypothetical protein BH10BAC2_BH10BAC2_18110 [soil metagenome]